MSDSKFEYIDDVILDVDKDRVEKKKKSPVKPLALLILGAAILWYGANYINTAQSDTLSSVVIMLDKGSNACPAWWLECCRFQVSCRG